MKWGNQIESEDVLLIIPSHLAGSASIEFSIKLVTAFVTVATNNRHLFAAGNYNFWFRMIYLFTNITRKKSVSVPQELES